MTSTPLVAVIVRTKNRTVLLNRALESVLNQTYPNWRMVIVNDGGDPDAVDRLVTHHAHRMAGRVQIIHEPRSLGMQGASAVGFSHAQGELMAVHDDDDSWAPEFLASTIATLASTRVTCPSVQGVMTYTNRVRERIRGNIINIESVEPFDSPLPAGLLSLDRILFSNVLPPISFLFSREAFDNLGATYETVPYIGDWDFLIRFLVQHDIYLSPRYLAFYHCRVDERLDNLSNSITAEVDQHHFHRQMLLNRWLRQDLASGRFGIGTYANLRAHLEALLQRS